MYEIRQRGCHNAASHIDSPQLTRSSLGSLRQLCTAPLPVEPTARVIALTLRSYIAHVTVACIPRLFFDYNEQWPLLADIDSNLSRPCVVTLDAPASAATSSKSRANPSPVQNQHVAIWHLSTPFSMSRLHRTR